MLRGFLLVVLSLYAALPPGVCACRLDAILWAALSPERLPDCVDDPSEHDHHCPGAKRLFVQAEQPAPIYSDFYGQVPVVEHILVVPCADKTRTVVPFHDVIHPRLIVTLCALRI
jgi:hypothetical protein